jgi:hypothetical protein
VGVTLNLCHWLRAEGADSMERVMKLALPRLSLVTINGADRDAKEWIQPLDTGDFDISASCARWCLGYRGPVGLRATALRAAGSSLPSLLRSVKRGAPCGRWGSPGGYRST